MSVYYFPSVFQNGAKCVDVANNSSPMMIPLKCHPFERHDSLVKIASNRFTPKLHVIASNPRISCTALAFIKPR